MPRIDDALASLEGNKFFTAIDMASAYRQVPIAEEGQLEQRFGPQQARTKPYQKATLPKPGEELGRQKRQVTKKQLATSLTTKSGKRQVTKKRLATNLTTKSGKRQVTKKKLAASLTTKSGKAVSKSKRNDRKNNNKTIWRLPCRDIVLFGAVASQK
jgi:hypothetical protein